MGPTHPEPEAVGRAGMTTIDLPEDSAALLSGGVADNLPAAHPWP